MPPGPVMLQMMAAARRQMRGAASGLEAHSSTRAFAEAYRPIPGRGEAVDFTRYSHLRDPYEDNAHTLVTMAGAQTGKTSKLLWRLLRHAVMDWGGHVGVYYPDDRTAEKNSMRFEEFAKAIDAFRPFFGRGDEIRTGRDNLSVRTFGATTLYFQSIEGKSTTESTPMSVVFFDELRWMRANRVRLAEERTSGQDAMKVYVVKAGTALHPNSDIHAAFMAGDQRFFHSDCRCPGGVSLSETFPECVVDLQGATLETKREVDRACVLAGVPYCGVSDEERREFGEGVLRCPRCGTYLLRPRDGWWLAHNPGGAIHSYQFSQMLSPQMSGPRLAQKLHRPSSGIIDMASMYRDVAGMPYVGSEDLGITHERLVSMVRTDLIWPANMSLEWRRANVANTAMGIDHMKGYNCVWIKQMAPNGKARTVHLEVAHGDNPWVRCGVLMDEYDVTCCVVEEGPNYNEALRFADAFPSRVYLMHFSNGRSGDMAKWKQPSKAIRGEEISSTRYVVTVNQDRAMQWSMDWLQRRGAEFPDPRGLVQKLKKKGGKVVFSPELRDGAWEPAAILEEAVWPHLEAVAFAKRFRDGAEDGDVGARYDKEFTPIGMDPHFAHAGMMADLALMQIGGIAPEQDYAQPEVGGLEDRRVSDDEIRRMLAGTGPRR